MYCVQYKLRKKYKNELHLEIYVVSKKANLVPISLLIFFDVNSYQFSGETIKASKNTEAGLAHVGIIQLYDLTHIKKTIVRKAF